MFICLSDGLSVFVSHVSGSSLVPRLHSPAFIALCISWGVESGEWSLGGTRLSGSSYVNFSVCVSVWVTLAIAAKIFQPWLGYWSCTFDLPSWIVTMFS